jgi:hypothetical protein
LEIDVNIKADYRVEINDRERIKMMPKQSTVTTLVTTLAIGFAAVQLAEAQQQQQQQPLSSRFKFDDLVSVGQSELGGQRVHVHVPYIVTLDVDTRPNHQGARLSLTVLNFLHVDLNRVHYPNGEKAGPISVRFGPFNLYQNQEAIEGKVPAEPGSLRDTLIRPLESLTNSRQSADASARVPAEPGSLRDTLIRPLESLTNSMQSADASARVPGSLPTSTV